jgi:hypothetical protein
MWLNDGAVEVNESSLMSGQCTYDVWRNDNDATSSTVRSLNSSHNGAIRNDSGFGDETPCGVSMEFCLFKANGDHNCLLVGYWEGAGGGSPKLSSLLFINNSCVSDMDYPGLICAVVSCTCSASVFHSNLVDFLVGGYSLVVTITVSGCIFDSEPLATKCAFIADSYQVNPNATVAWTAGLLLCSLTRTQPRSRSPSMSSMITVNKSLSLGVIAGIVIGTVAIILGAAITIFCLFCQRS